jgi:periplasmic protein TonB
MDHFEIWMFGGLREDSSEFLRRVISRPSPVYPQIAQRAGIRGVVLVQVKVKTDGSVEVMKVLQGEPILAEAATDALKKWRARPAVINGTKVEIISTVKFDFEFP